MDISVEEKVCPYTNEQLNDMKREHIASMCDIGAFEMYKEAEKRGYNPHTAIFKFYAGEPQEWEQVEQCPYTDEHIKDMEREHVASMCDIEAFEIYKEAEKRGYNPLIAINRYYTG
jgi:arginyl-tRNA--protein-N-Asp/Glu arginylyltransferase